MDESTRRMSTLHISGEGLPQNLYLFPLTRSVIFPNLVVPMSINPGPLQEIIERAQAHNDYIGFVYRKEPLSEGEPSVLSEIGSVARVEKITTTPEGELNLLVRSLHRFRIVSFLKSERIIAEVEYLEDIQEESDELQALWRNVQRLLGTLVEHNPQIPNEMMEHILGMESPGRLADMVAAHFPLPLDEKQEILELLDVHQRLESVYVRMVREMDLLELGQKIHEQIRMEIEKSQREFFLREQLKVIRQELGEERDEQALNVEEYEARIAEAKMSDEAEKRAIEQLGRLKLLPPDAAEYNMIRTYLDWLCDLPWAKLSEDDLDLDRAQKILDRDHFGLSDIKERIVEFLAVKKLKPGHQGQIICFVGPPGVGKTSLGRSINRALGREFYGFSLGGMRDEAEIKGHRRTYIGAMPGKLIQGLKRVGTRNPVFILDEIDKLGSDWRGDPSSAMLEVLDPEQNDRFMDNYIDVAFDLSEVMFIATANTTATIPRPLLDRMEVIELAGYIEEEKIQIAKRHLVPKQRAAHGLKASQFKITEGALRELIRQHTREAGVRNLERTIARVCRKVAARVAKGISQGERIVIKNLEEYLGPPRYLEEVLSRGQAPGIAAGLAWTQFGGEILFVEATSMVGREQLKLTGKLGDVMSESVQIAFSYVRANMELFGLDEELFKGRSFHVHFPAGAIPKDGPSAGITVVSSLLSLLLQRSLPDRLAMTGELTLIGNVLPVGGIKEKITAARRAGARTVILPASNDKDLTEVPEHVRGDLTFHFVENYKQVYKVLFGALKKPAEKK